jgi:hypothetical protein
MAIPFKVNLRSLFIRKVSTLTTIACLALVVGVFSAMMALANGLEHTFHASGDPLNVLVLRAGSTAETNSGISVEQYQILKSLPGVAKRANGTPIATGEVVTIINQNKRGTKDGANIILRGVPPEAFEAHPEVKVVEGRTYQPGKSELIASRSIAAKFEGCRLGETLTLRKRAFTIVGIFEAAGTAKGSRSGGRGRGQRHVQADRLLLERPPSRRRSFRGRHDQGGDRGRPASQARRGPGAGVLHEADPPVDADQGGGPVPGRDPRSRGRVRSGEHDVRRRVVAPRRRSARCERSASRASRSSRPTSPSRSFSGSLGDRRNLGLYAHIALFGGETGTANWDTFSEVSFAFRVTPVLIAIAIAFRRSSERSGAFSPARFAVRPDHHRPPGG